MVKIYEGKFDAKGKKFCLIVSRFNSFITERLVEGALDGLIRHGVSENDIAKVYVPGAFEIPLAVQKVAQSKKYDAILALGAIIRGSTPHFDYVAAEASKGVAHAMLSSGVPVSFGILTTDTIEQAIERSGTKSGNKGYDAAMTAIEMSDLMSLL